MYTRREFGKMAFAGLALPRIAGAAINPIVNGRPTASANCRGRRAATRSIR